MTTLVPGKRFYKRRRCGIWMVLISVLSIVIIFKLNVLLIISSGQLTNHKERLFNDDFQDTLYKIRNILYNNHNNNNDLKTRQAQSINDTDFMYHKIILDENADTLIRIGDLLKKKKGQTILNRNISSSKISNNDDQLIKIKGWKPFYVDKNLEGAINDESKRTEILELIKYIEEWDPFYIKFPDEQSQDAILVHFNLDEAIYDYLVQKVDNFETQRKPVQLPEPQHLNLYDDVTEPLGSWRIFHKNITNYRLYSPDNPLLKKILYEMRTLPLVEAEQPTRGTQQKVLYHLSNGLRVVFKPRRFPRGQEAIPDHVFWRDFERHFAEIAAHHLDRVFEFYRVPPTVGRYISVARDIEDLDHEGKLNFFWSPAGNRCFYGKCTYYCDTGHAICGRPDVLEGSFMMYIPSRIYAPRNRIRSPWRRAYSETSKADWYYEYDYCDKVRKTPPYNSGRRMLDMMDLSVFDFIAGNMDRHHYEFFSDFGNFTIPVLYDNGRGFGKSKHDELTILAPLYQCCLVRYTTLKKLLAFHKGPRHISDAMRESLKEDLASPVLEEVMLLALDRRVDIILRTVYECIVKHGYDHVVKDDGI